MKILFIINGLKAFGKGNIKLRSDLNDNFETLIALFFRLRRRIIKPHVFTIHIDEKQQRQSRTITSVRAP